MGLFILGSEVRNGEIGDSGLEAFEVCRFKELISILGKFGNFISKPSSISVGNPFRVDCSVGGVVFS